MSQGSHFQWDAQPGPLDFAAPENCRLRSRRCHKLAAVLRTFFYAVVALQIGSASGAEPRQTRIGGSQFVGAAGCKSSSCHGGAGEKRSQHITWMRHDVHTRGFAILTNARSDRMADSLKLPQQQEGMLRATTSARCTVCHSPFQALSQAQRPPAADPTESVSCESCHGAARVWLRGHTRTDWTYATRVGAGMRDLKSFYVRANTCVACHQNLDADIAAAGHPDLLFEMDRQTVAQPRHWRDPEGSGVRAWLVGQAVALRETSWKLAQSPLGNEQTLDQWRGLAWLLSRVTASDRTLLPVEFPGPGEVVVYSRTQQQADALARRAAQQNFTAAFAQRMLNELTTTHSEFVVTSDTPREVLFRRAQRLVLALEALDAENKAPSEHLTSLRDNLQYPYNFDPAQFAAKLEKLRHAPASSAR